MDFCSIASSSNGNCTYVGSTNTHVLVDAGLSGKRTESGLNSVDRTLKEMDAILITHEHSDHIKGLGVLARKYELPIYATAGTIQAIRQASQVGTIPEDLFREIRPDEAFCVGDLNVLPFTISHDAAQPVGYRLECENKSVGIATDLGEYSDYTVEKLKHLDALLLEANHDVNMLQVGSYPYYLKRRILSETGHLSNENAGRLLSRVLHDDLKAVFLGHLSQENNYDKLAYETVCQEIDSGENPYRSRDFYIQVAKRAQVSERITV